MTEPKPEWYDPEPIERSITEPSTVGDLGDFVHLHVHSNLSFKDSINVVEETAKWAAISGQKALALTDHGHMFGSIRHAFACREAGIAPIFGMEAYESHVDNLHEGEDAAYPAHLTLLAMNRQGWENLCQIHTKSHQAPYALKAKTGSRVYPRVDRHLMEQHSEGIICMSACLGGRIQREFMNPDVNKDDQHLLNTMKWYREVFGDRFYVELMGNTNEQRAILYRQREICKKDKIPTVATNDVHYLTQEQGKMYGAHHIYSCARYGNDPLKNRPADEVEGERSRFGWYGSDEFFLKSADQMHDTGFSSTEIERSVEIAERCVSSGFTPIDLNFSMPPAPLDAVDDFWLFEMWQKSKDKVLI